MESLSLKQSQKVSVKQKGKSVSFKCEVTGLGSGNFVHWYYRKKEDEPLKRLLYISHSGTATSDAKEFVSEKVGNSYGIKLKTTTDDHTGIYYCACWDGSHSERTLWHLLHKPWETVVPQKELCQNLTIINHIYYSIDCLTDTLWEEPQNSAVWCSKYDCR